MFANTACAYALWVVLGLFGAHRFYVGRPVSGLVWLLTGGLFGIGWIIDFFLIPEFVEEHNKKVFHQQMLETGSSLLFDGEYGAQGYVADGGGAFSGQVAPYAQHVYYAQPQTGYAQVPQRGGGGGGGYGAYY